MRNSILVPIRDLEPEWNTAMYGLFNLSDIHTRIVTSCPRVVNTVVPPSAERKNSAAAGHRLPNANRKRHPPSAGVSSLCLSALLGSHLSLGFCIQLCGLSPVVFNFLRVSGSNALRRHT